MYFLIVQVIISWISHFLQRLIKSPAFSMVACRRERRRAARVAGTTVAAARLESLGPGRSVTNGFKWHTRLKKVGHRE